MLGVVQKIMNKSINIVIAAIAASATIACSAPKNLPVEKISQAVEGMMKEHHDWLAAKPRKVTIQFLEAEDLPAELTRIGFKSAAIEDGFVILISTDEGEEEMTGILFVTDGKNHGELMKRYGWTLSDSSDRRIKHIKKRAQQVAP